MLRIHIGSGRLRLRFTLTLTLRLMIRLILRLSTSRREELHAGIVSVCDNNITCIR